MFKKLILKQFPFLLIYTNIIFGQTVQETNDASFIKSVVFKSKNDKFQLPIVALGEVFELSFDDLNADERNYYYRIKYFNHDWTPTILFQSEFMRGWYMSSWLCGAASLKSALPQHAGRCLAPPRDRV